jgi:hypothetical protein
MKSSAWVASSSGSAGHEQEWVGEFDDPKDTTVVIVEITDPPIPAPGLTVMAVILFMGKVGGAHLNPVVSLAFALRSEFPWRRVPGYVLAQIVGGVLACVFLWAVVGRPSTLGATVPAPGLGDVRAMLVEVVLTMGLVSVILGTASSAPNVGGCLRLQWAPPSRWQDCGRARSAEHR